MTLARVVLFAFAAAIGSGLFSSPLRADTWDLASSFPTTAGGNVLTPTHRWVLGRYTNGLDPTSFVPFASLDTTTIPGVAIWRNATGPIDPNISMNTTGSTITGSGITWDPNHVVLGPYLGPTVARWVAPADTLYNISGSVTTVQSGNSAPNLYFYINQNLLPGGAVPAYPAATPFGIQNVMLPVGTTFDIVVFGNNSDNKSTWVSATITAPSLATVPEPASAFVFAIAVFGAAAVRRRNA